MQPTTAPRMKPVDWILLVALSILWGGSFFFNGIIVRELPPLFAVVCRVGLASVVLFTLLRVLRIAPPKGARVWSALFGMGLLNNVIPFSLIVWGQTHIASGLASIFNATTPLFTVLIAHVLTHDEKLTAAKLTGVGLGIAGVTAMVGPDLLHGIGRDALAQLAIVGAAISYAFAGIFGRRFKAMGIAPVATAAGQVAASTVMLLPVAMIVDRPWTLAMPSMPTLAAIVGLAVLSTALAYILFFRILASAGATNVMLVTLLVPVSAILLGVVVLGERLMLVDLIGMALIALGLAAIDGRVLRWLVSRHKALA